MELPIEFFFVVKSWAIHFIDEKQFDKNIVLYLQTPSKEITNMLSEIPYHCPNKIHILSSTWNSRKIHVLKSENQDEQYFVQFYYIKNKNTDNCENLKIKIKRHNNSVYAFILDDNDKIWVDSFALYWNDYKEKDSKWNLCKNYESYQ